MPFAPHMRVALLAEFRLGSADGPTVEYAQPGLSISTTDLTQHDLETIRDLIVNRWGDPEMTIPQLCVLTGVKFSRVTPSGHIDGTPVTFAITGALGGGQNDRPTFQAIVATLESDAVGVERRKRGRIYFPSGAVCNAGVYGGATVDRFAAKVSDILGEINSTIDGLGYVCTASKTAGINYRVNAVTADNVPDYVSSRKRSLQGTRSARHVV